MNIDAELAYLIYLRWNEDLPAAACAWRRLYQNNCMDGDYEKLVKQGRPLTDTQQQVLATLRNRGAEWSASAAEDAWRKGRPAFFDARNAATKGIKRLIARANKEVTP